MVTPGTWERWDEANQIVAKILRCVGGLVGFTIVADGNTRYLGAVGRS
jgi:hypothetical protein